MPMDLAKCRITVIKMTVNQDLADEYLTGDWEFGVCNCFNEGQQFMVEQPFALPEGFCAWAWADIRRDILTAMGGGNMPGVKKGVIISGCTDWFRPVYFKIERLD